MGSPRDGEELRPGDAVDGRVRSRLLAGTAGRSALRAHHGGLPSGSTATQLASAAVGVVALATKAALTLLAKGWTLHPDPFAQGGRREPTTHVLPTLLSLDHPTDRFCSISGSDHGARRVGMYRRFGDVRWVLHLLVEAYPAVD